MISIEFSLICWSLVETLKGKGFFSVSGKELKSILVERLVQLENRLTQSHYRDAPVPSLQQVT